MATYSAVDGLVQDFHLVHLGARALGGAALDRHSYGRHSLGLQLGASLALTPPLDLPALGRRQSVYVVGTTLHRPVFLINSSMGHFSAAPQSFGREDLHSTGHPFSRSYGVNLPSSLTAFLSSALGYSPHPPVSVLVRIPSCFLEDFLVGWSCNFALAGSLSLLGFR